MQWVKGVVGIILTLIGLLFVGQGTGLIQGSALMSGQPLWAVIGLIVLVIGAWLLRSVLGSRRSAGTRTS